MSKLQCVQSLFLLNDTKIDIYLLAENVITFEDFLPSYFYFLSKVKTIWAQSLLWDVSVPALDESFCAAEIAAQISAPRQDDCLMTGLLLAEQHTRAGIFDFKLSANAALMNARGLRCAAAHCLQSRSTMTLLSLKGLCRQGRTIEPQGEEATV